MKKLLRKILPLSLFLRVKDAYRRLRYTIKSLLVRLKIKLSLPLKPKRRKIRFEVHVAEHCNLNCKSCDNFSCIAEPELVDVEEFRRDFERLGEIFSHDCGNIYLIGGEPLLHPDIITLMQTARRNFTNGRIEIFTNGLLLNKMPDDFWRACHDNNVGIHVSEYPIKIDIERIKSLTQKFDVAFVWSASRETFRVEPLNLEGSGNAALNFGLCVKANGCIALSHGRMFTCTFAPNVRHFNKRFGTDIRITPEDSIDIYEEGITADEILERLSRPIPACRYCNPAGYRTKEIKWGITEGRISEWQ